MRFKFFMKKCPFRKRYKIITVVWGKGFTPLSGGSKYFAKKITFSLVASLYRFRKAFREWRLALFGLELHYRSE